MAEHCPCTGWCITYIVEPGEHHHRDCKRWHKKLDADVFVTRTELLITGDPGHDENHNCDALGCSSVSHVLYRLPLPDGVTPSQPQRRYRHIGYAKYVPHSVGGGSSLVCCGPDEPGAFRMFREPPTHGVPGTLEENGNG